MAANYTFGCAAFLHHENSVLMTVVFHRAPVVLPSDALLLFQNEMQSIVQAIAWLQHTLTLP